jgi:hypothetical protein
MIQLPPRTSDLGAETRLLLAECRGPSYPAYNAADAKLCMQLMHLVLSNRLKAPKRFLAAHATLLAVITAPGQFQGFQHYPRYDSRIVHNLQTMIDIANSHHDKRPVMFAAFIRTAIEVAKGAPIRDPSPGTLAAWRTISSGSPGDDFTLFKTVAGTSFYYLSK